MGEDGTPRFGELLRRHRLRAGLTREELAERAGLSVRGIAGLEGGERRSPRRDTLRLLAEALDLSSADRAELKEAASGRRGPPLPESLPQQLSPAPRHNLPAQLTSFVGRGRETSEIWELLLGPDTRLLTLTGVGGTGKTRLAIRVAGAALDSFPDGVWFVELSPITDADLVMSAIARVLGVRESSDSSLVESLKAYLRRRSLLLVLDNFEQVLDAGNLVAKLLSAAPGIKALVTSRAALRLSVEHLYSVPPLDLPDRAHLPAVEPLLQNESVRLFIDRARAVRPDFALSLRNASAIAEICARLDGLPLAIELATVRARLFDPEAILARLDGRLKLLQGGPRDAPARQRSLRAAIEWSYSLLGEDAQTLFCKLSVFASGSTLDAAEAVCAPDGELDVLGGVESLVDSSLLRPLESASGEPRFGMLETVREYALEKLEESGETEELRRRHAEYFFRLAETAQDHSETSRKLEWIRRLDAEIDNLRSALSWTLGSDDPGTGLRLACSLGWYCEVRGYLSEGRAWLERGMAAAQNPPPSLRARSLYSLSSIAHVQGDYAWAVPWAEESLAMYRQLGDRKAVARALLNLGWTLLHRGDAVTLPLFEEALGLCRELGDEFGIAVGLMGVGRIAVLEDDLERAVGLRDEALALARKLGDELMIARGAYGVAWTALALGDLEKAQVHYEESLGLLNRMGDRWGVAVVLEGLAAATAAYGEDMHAALLAGAASATLESVGAAALHTDRAHPRPFLDTARERLGEEGWQAAWEAGRVMDLEEVIEHALRVGAGSAPDDS